MSVYGSSSTPRARAIVYRPSKRRLTPAQFLLRVFAGLIIVLLVSCPLLYVFERFPASSPGLSGRSPSPLEDAHLPSISYCSRTLNQAHFSSLGSLKTMKKGMRGRSACSLSALNPLPEAPELQERKEAAKHEDRPREHHQPAPACNLV